MKIALILSQAGKPCIDQSLPVEEGVFLLEPFDLESEQPSLRKAIVVRFPIRERVRKVFMKEVELEQQALLQELVGIAGVKIDARLSAPQIVKLGLSVTARFAANWQDAQLLSAGFGFGATPLLDAFLGRVKSQFVEFGDPSFVVVFSPIELVPHRIEDRLSGERRKLGVDLLNKPHYGQIAFEVDPAAENLSERLLVVGAMILLERREEMVGDPYSYLQQAELLLIVCQSD